MTVNKERPKKKYKLKVKTNNTITTKIKHTRSKIYRDIQQLDTTPRTLDIASRSNNELYLQASRTLHQLRHEVNRTKIGGKCTLFTRRFSQNDDAIFHMRANPILNDLGFIIYSDGGFSPSKNVGTWSYIIQLYDYASCSISDDIAVTKYIGTMNETDRNLLGVRNYINNNTEKRKIANWVQSNNAERIFSKESEMYTMSDKVLIMEIVAVDSALDLIKQYKHRLNIKRVTVFSDSKNMCDWKEVLARYKKDEWYDTFQHRFVPLEIRQIWLMLERMSEEFDIKFIFTKGHTGIPFNEHCNEMCQLRRILYDGNAQLPYTYYYMSI